RRCRRSAPGSTVWRSVLLHAASTYRRPPPGRFEGSTRTAGCASRSVLCAQPAARPIDRGISSRTTGHRPCNGLSGLLALALPGDGDDGAWHWKRHVLQHGLAGSTSADDVEAVSLTAARSGDR